MPEVGVPMKPRLQVRVKVGALMFVIAAGLACGPRGPAEEPPAGTPARTTALSTAKKAVVVTGPTLVAFFAISQSEVDADPDGAEALGDFRHHLGGARAALERAGFAVHETYADTVRLLVSGRTIDFRPREHSVRIGYYLIAPGRAPQIEYGVLTNDDVVDVAMAYFRRTDDSSRLY